MSPRHSAHMVTDSQSLLLSSARHPSEVRSPKTSPLFVILQVARGPENAEDFLRRWQASFDETEHGTKGIKHGGRRGGRGAAPPGSPPLRWKGPFDRVPISEQEPRGHVLAPDLPPQAEADMLLFERCLFVLRR